MKVIGHQGKDRSMVGDTNVVELNEFVFYGMIF